MNTDFSNEVTPSSDSLRPDASPLRGYQTLRTLLGVSALIGMFMILDTLLQSGSRLSEQTYRAHANIWLGLIYSVKPAFLILCCGSIAALLIWPRKLLTVWGHGTARQPLRWFTVALAALIAWPFVTYGYNYYFDHSHMLDRGLLALLALGVMWRPIFLLPFLCLVYAVMWQLNVPDLGSPIFAHKLMILQPLTAVLSWWLLRAAFPFLRISHALFVIAAIVAGRYWEAGFAKFQLDWAAHGEVHNALYSAYARGWLATWSQDSIDMLSRFIMIFAPVTGWGIIGFEMAAVGLLLHRWIAVVILGLAILFHAAVFVLLGFLFWTWIAVDIALLLVLFAAHRKRHKVFGLRAFGITAIPIVLSSLWSHPPQLAWFDTPVSYAFHYEVTGGDGLRYQLPASEFAPYNDSFTMASFGALFQDHAALTGAYGITKHQHILELIGRIKTSEDIPVLEKEAGEPRYSEGFSARLEKFISRYWQNRNQKGDQLQMLRMIEAPRQFWAMPRHDVDLPVYSGQTAVRSFSMFGVTTWFDGQSVHTVRREEVLSIEIPETSQ